jgi:signal transduction histidine kinase
MENPSADERSYLEELSDKGEIAGPLAHEFNNVLNTIVLQSALLEPHMSAAARDDLAVIRKQANVLTELVRDFQRYRKRERQTHISTQLNLAVQKAFDKLSAIDPRFRNAIALDLDSALPDIRVSGFDLERLVRFLLGNACAAAAYEVGSVKVHTCHGAPGKVALHVEDSGPGMAADSLDLAFELAMLPREGTNRLELAACKSIVRRSNGTIRATNRSEGGIRVVVEWEAAAPP